MVVAMNVCTFVLGAFETNSYVVTADEEAKNCVVIDTGLDAGPLMDHLKEAGLNPVGVIFTHGHADHILGVNMLRENWPGIKVAIHKEDAVAVAPGQAVGYLADRTIPASGYDDAVAFGHSLASVSCGLFRAMSLPEGQLPAVVFQVGHGCFQFVTPVPLTGVGIENNLSFH